MSARQLPQADYLAVKAATRALVKACGGGVAAAAVTRVRQQELSDYGNPAAAQAERFMPIDIVADLEAECGLLPVTEALAALSGAVVIRLPEVGGMDGVLEGSGVLTQKLGALMTEVGAALQDGAISPEESARIVGRVNVLIVAAHSFARQVELESNQQNAEGER